MRTEALLAVVVRVMLEDLPDHARQRRIERFLILADELPDAEARALAVAIATYIEDAAITNAQQSQPASFR